MRTDSFKGCIGIGLFENLEGILITDSRILLVNLLDFLVVSRCDRFHIIAAMGCNCIQFLVAQILALTAFSRLFTLTRRIFLGFRFAACLAVVGDKVNALGNVIRRFAVGRSKENNCDQKHNKKGKGQHVQNCRNDQLKHGLAVFLFETSDTIRKEGAVFLGAFLLLDDLYNGDDLKDHARNNRQN